MDALLPWLRRTGWVYIALALAVAAVAWRMAGGGGAPQVQPPGGGGVSVAEAPAGGAEAVAGGAPAAERAVVHVVGAVRRPGVYVLREGARVQGAVRLAGGATPRADLAALNLAARVADGQRIEVPRRGQAPGGPAPAGGGGAPGSGPLSLSAATEQELDGLDGIGPTLASRIVAWREANGSFRSVEQLLEVEGIGPGRLESLRRQVVP